MGTLGNYRNPGSKLNTRVKRRRFHNYFVTEESNIFESTNYVDDDRASVPRIAATRASSAAKETSRRTFLETDDFTSSILTS